MEAITEIGEIGIHAENGKSFLLRPSLLAMTRLGTGKDIVSIFSRVMDENPDFLDALGVVYSCYEGDDDISPVFGAMVSDGVELRYEQGATRPSNIVHMARSLLVHGVVGAHKPLPRKADETPQYTNEFSARDHVAAAIAHLGISEREAWNMTMTSIVGAMRSKFPQTDAPGTQAPSIEEYEADMARLDKINEIRRKQKGLH